MVWLRVDEDLEEDRLTIEVEDNGRGMGEETMNRVKDPFFTTRKTRHVGLGLPLFAAATERCEGDLKVQARPGGGTRATAVFRQSHIDRAPLGDMPRTLLSFLLGEPFCDLVYCHRKGGNTYRLDTREVCRELGPVPLTHPTVREWLVQYLKQAEQSLDVPAGGSLASSAGAGR